MASKFFDQDSEHGRAKRVILHKILQAWYPIHYYRGYQRICYIDGFAGAGIYGESELAEGTDETTERINEVCKVGSPCIALNDLGVCFADLTRCLARQEDLLPPPRGVGITVSQLLNTQHNELNSRVTKYNLRPPLHADIVLVEKKAKVMKLLRQAMRTMNPRIFTKEGTVHMTEQNFMTYHICDKEMAFQKAHEELAKEFLQTKDLHPIRSVPVQRPTLAFLDPFGYSDIPMQIVESYLGVNKCVLITLMVGYLIPSLNQSKIDGLLGSKDWKNLPPVLSPDYWCKRFAKLYEGQLKNKGADFTLSFAMRDEKNKLKYYMIFATNDLTILSKAKEALNRVTQGPEMLTFSAYFIRKDMQMLTWSNEQNNEDLADLIWKDFKGQHDVLVRDIGDHVTIDTPYVFRKGALVILYDHGKVSYIEGANRPIKRTFPDDCLVKFAFSEEDAAQLKKLQNPESEAQEAEGIWYKYKGRPEIMVRDIDPKWKKSLVILYDQGKVSYIEGGAPPIKRTFPDGFRVKFASSEEDAAQLKKLQNPATPAQEAEGIWYKYHWRLNIRVGDIKPKWKTSLKKMLQSGRLTYVPGFEPRRNGDFPDDTLVSFSDPVMMIAGNLNQLNL